MSPNNWKHHFEGRYICMNFGLHAVLAYKTALKRISGNFKRKKVNWWWQRYRISLTNYSIYIFGLRYLGPFGTPALWVYFYVRDKSKSDWKTERSFREGGTHHSHVSRLFIFADRIFSCFAAFPCRYFLLQESLQLDTIIGRNGTSGSIGPSRPRPAIEPFFGFSWWTTTYPNVDIQAHALLISLSSVKLDDSIPRA